MAECAYYRAYKRAIRSLMGDASFDGAWALPFLYAVSLEEPLLRARLNEGLECPTLQLVFPSGIASLWDAGQSCCEHRYMTTDDELETFKDAKLVGIDRVYVEDETEYGDPHEQVFVKVETTKGTITCVTHNQHNGYYGGFDIRSTWEKRGG